MHRLDKDTSGLMVAAKSDAAHQGLADLFADHGRSGSLVREYAALAWNGFPGAQGRWTPPSPATRTRASAWRSLRAAATPSPTGASRRRSARRLGCAAGWRPGERTRFGSIWPISDTRCSAISSMAAGFRTKANRLGEAAQAALAALNRQALHAQTLGFEHPVTMESLHFDRPPPLDFLNLAGALRV